MNKAVLFVTAVMLCSMPAAWAQDGGLHGTIDATYVSRYIWRGYDAYSTNDSAFQPSVDLDLFGTGFGANFWMSRANESGYENAEWNVYTLYYRNRAFDGEAFATNYKVGYSYFGYPDGPREGVASAADPFGSTGHAQEFFGMFQWPDLLPGGIVPSYAAFAYWNSESGAANRHNAGWAHVFGLSYGFQLETQTIDLGAHAVYNDGVGPAGFTADHDWSHAVFSVATTFDLGNNLFFTPGFNYQSSWDDSINASDEYWTSLSLSYKF